MKPFNMDFDEFVGQLNPLTDAQWFVCRNAGLLPEDLEDKSHYWYQQHRQELVKGTDGDDAPALATQLKWFKCMGVNNVPHNISFDQCVNFIQAAILQDESEDRDERYIRYVAEHQKKKFKQNEQRRERYKRNKEKVVKMPEPQALDALTTGEPHKPRDGSEPQDDSIAYLRDFDWSKVPQ